MAEIQAIIFDMDGVIIDSQSRWVLLVEQLYRDFFPDLSLDQIKTLSQSIRGKSILDEYRILTGSYGFTMDKKAFLSMYDQAAQRLYREKAELSAHVIEFLEQVRGTYRLALASNSIHDWINIVLCRFSLAGYFGVITGADDLKGLGKPSPEIYLLTAERLGLAVETCVVVEDSIPGVTAAKAAGMRCLGYYGNGEIAHVREADIAIASFIDALQALSKLAALG